MRAYIEYINLLDMPIEYALVNFISKDFKVGRGIDASLEEVFGMKRYVSSFYMHNKETYPCAIYYPAYNLQPVINLVCKTSERATIKEEDVASVFKKLAYICKLKKIEYLAIPYAEPWGIIEKSILYCFKDMSLTIVVSMPGKKKSKSKPKEKRHGKNA